MVLLHLACDLENTTWHSLAPSSTTNECGTAPATPPWFSSQGNNDILFLWQIFSPTAFPDHFHFAPVQSNKPVHHPFDIILPKFDIIYSKGIIWTTTTPHPSADQGWQWKFQTLDWVLRWSQNKGGKVIYIFTSLINWLSFFCSWVHCLVFISCSLKYGIVDPQEAAIYIKNI